MEVKDTLTPDILVEEVTLRSDLWRPLLSVLDDADEVGVEVVIDTDELLELDEASEVTKGTEVTTTEEELLGASLPFSMSTLASALANLTMTGAGLSSDADAVFKAG
jgi:hypothetical protein